MVVWASGVNWDTPCLGYVESTWRVWKSVSYHDEAKSWVQVSSFAASLKVARKCC